MLEKAKQKVNDLKNRNRFWYWSITIFPFLLAIAAGVKVNIITWLLLNNVYTSIADKLAISYYTSIVFIIPVLEEIFKVGFFTGYKNFHKVRKTIDPAVINKKRIYTIIAAYAFQVSEAIFYKNILQESSWYLRFIFPSHIVFTFAASYCLLLGILLHMLWNGIAMMSVFEIPFLIFMYLFFFLLLYLRRKDFMIFFPSKSPSDASI